MTTNSNEPPEPFGESNEPGDSQESTTADGAGSEDTHTSRRGAPKLNKNALRHAFFSQLYENIVGNDPIAKAAVDDYLEMAIDTFHPGDPIAEGKARRLALMYYKRDQILECAETGERTCSVLRYRRSTRFKPFVSIAELMDKDRAAILRRSDGVAYVIATLEETLYAVGTAMTVDKVVTAVELFEQAFGAVLEAFEAKLAAGLPGLRHGEVSEMAIGDVVRWLRCRLHVLRAEELSLREEERTLAASEEARRRVAGTKHADRIARALREVNNEIRRLERDLEQQRRGRFFGR